MSEYAFQTLIELEMIQGICLAVIIALQEDKFFELGTKHGKFKNLLFAKKNITT
jgi:hypothetical protein